jgi:hypothetical protein
MPTSMTPFVTDRDLELSGPAVWPVMAPDLPVDRYIFQRPELPYRIALRRLAAGREKAKKEPSDKIWIVVRRLYFDGARTKSNNIAKLAHIINTEDELQDVKDFLKDLRRVLKRRMPDKLVLDTSIKLGFFDPDDKVKALIHWSKPWM